MAKEIERKYLVRDDQWRQGAVGIRIRQGYLSRGNGKTIRVRLAGDRGFLTIKGPTVGISRDEFEYSIPADDALSLLELCEGTIIEKTRHEIPYRGFVWEVDEFWGANEGLVVAEIELPTEDTKFDTPAWVGREVTDKGRYSNSRLSVIPYERWKDADEA